jgi:phage terminase large subunit GpA-like protein
MDIPLKEGVSSVFIEKASSIGVSEALRNLLGCLADLEPDPAGLVLPDRTKGRKIIAERIIPFFERTPRLAALLTGRRADVQKEMIKLVNSFTLWLAWAGSPATTKGDPWRCGFIDELDECAIAVARLGQTRDLVGAAIKRTRTFGDRGRMIAVSSPLDAFSEIEAQVRGARFLLEFYVPCPHCGGYQVLDLSHLRFTPEDDALKADKRSWAHWVMEDVNHAWYACRYCEGKIFEEQRPAMVRAGLWCSSTRTDADGKILGHSGVDAKGLPLPSDPIRGVIFDAEALDRFPRGSTIGMRIWAIYSLLGVTMTGIAAEFIAAQGDRGKMFTFTTETEGRVFEQQLIRADATLFGKKVERAKLPEGVVPAWAGKLLAAVDTQIDHFYLVIRAWGEDYLSQRVWHGKVNTFEELERMCFGTPWRCEDESCGPMTCEMIGIDSGGTTEEGADASRTIEVYRWAQKYKARVRALKGFESSRTGQFLWRGRGLLAESAEGHVRRRREIPLWCLVKGHWQAVLHDCIHAGLMGGRRGSAESEKWLLNKRRDKEYEDQLANAQQVVERMGGRAVEIWKPIHPRGRWDYRDCEVYQCVVASLARVDLLPPAGQIIAFRRELWKQTLEAQKDSRAKEPPRDAQEPWLRMDGKDWL